LTQQQQQAWNGTFDFAWQSILVSTVAVYPWSYVWHSAVVMAVAIYLYALNY
jgi:hypothetical protein